MAPGALRLLAPPLLLLLGVTAAPSSLADEVPGVAQGQVRVLYPRGRCQSGWLRVEVWDRVDNRWRPHPRHALVPAGQCRSEDPGILLNEIRVACIDPSGRWAPSPWVVGVQLAPGAPASVCPEAVPDPAPAAPAD